MSERTKAILLLRAVERDIEIYLDREMRARARAESASCSEIAKQVLSIIRSYIHQLEQQEIESLQKEIFNS